MAYQWEAQLGYGVVSAYSKVCEGALVDANSLKLMSKMRVLTAPF